MKFYFSLLIAVLITTGFLVLHTSKQQAFAEQVHIRQQVEREDAMKKDNRAFTAKFLLYTNGTQRILSGKKYALQWPNAYITATEPTHVHVTEKGVTWAQFFQSLDVQINGTCLVLSEQQQFCGDHVNSLKFYLNGKKDPAALTKEIHDSDLFLVTYGGENQVELKKQIEAVKNLK